MTPNRLIPERIAKLSSGSIPPTPEKDVMSETVWLGWVGLVGWAGLVGLVRSGSMD